MLQTWQTLQLIADASTTEKNSSQHTGVSVIKLLFFVTEEVAKLIRAFAFLVRPNNLYLEPRMEHLPGDSDFVGQVN